MYNMDYHDHHHHQDRSLSPNPNSLKRRFALGFLKALTRIRNRGSDSPKAVARRRRRVKAAADAAMASAVGPGMAWSRAVLRRIRSQKRRRFMIRSSNNNKHDHHGLKLVGQEEKLRDLVPGGEDMDVHRLLDETLHYIRCLTTQVKVMKRIDDIYSGTTT